MEKSFEIKEVFTDLRPAKVAVLVHKGYGWQEKCLKVMETFSEIWGGAKNIIVPTDGKTIDEKFWFLLEKFDPDYLYLYNDREGKYKDISEELKNAILKRLNPFYDSRTGKDPIESTFFNHGWPLTFLPDIIPNTKIENNKMYNPIINYNLADSPNYVKLMIHSVLGKIADSYYEKISGLGVKIEEKDFSSTDLGVILDIAWKSESHSCYPFYYSMLKLTSYHNMKDNREIRSSPIIVVIGDSLNDFCLYYNLSSLRYSVYWAPYSIIMTSYKELEKNSMSGAHSFSKLASFNLYLAEELSNKILDSHFDQKIILTSVSKLKTNLERIKDILMTYMTISYTSRDNKDNNELISISKDMDKLLPYKLRVLEYDNYFNSYREQFIDSKSINPIRTPIPRNFTHRSFDNHYWVTEVNIEGYKLPPNSILSDSLEARIYSNHEIRTSNNGLAYFCPHIGYMGESIDKYITKPYIKLLKPFEIFEKIFNEVSYCILTSDKGNYERESTEKFGSLENIAKFLINEKYQNLFNNFVKKNNPTSSDDGIFLKDDFRMYMSLKAIKRALGGEADTIINDFIEKEILHRGFIFKCEKCKYTGWYDIEDVDIKFKCRRCRKIQYYNSKHLVRQNPIEPEWFYKLDESIYQGYDNDMIVPILTLYKLKNLSEESFLYTSEIEIREKENPEAQYREIDICCISDGKIIIGECKINNRLKDEEIEKYKDIYEEIGADKIIFSTFNQTGWSRGTISKFKKILGEEINYELFNKEDLLFNS